MKCPDCGALVSDLFIEGGDIAHRCMKCGGILMSSTTANKLSARQIELWRRITIPNQYTASGTGKCPMDGTMMIRYNGDAVPKTVLVMRCMRCGQWWFPRDSIFDFKPAQEAKINYFKWWGFTSDMATAVLPLVLLLLMTGGLLGGVLLVKQNTNLPISASERLTDLQMAQIGPGTMEISFKVTGKIEDIEYRKLDKLDYVKVGLEFNNGRYVAKLDGLVEGSYVIKILGQEYRFVVVD